MKNARGMGLMDALILLILISGLIGLVFINERIKTQQAQQADGVGIQSREMAVLARAAFSYFLTDGKMPAAGTNVALDPNTLVTEAYVPAQFAYRPGTSAPTSPVGQPYKIIGRSGSAGGLEILVYASGAAVPGMLARVGFKDSPESRQDYGLTVIRQLTNEYNLTAGWVKANTKMLDVIATGVNKDLALFVTDNFQNDTVMLYSGMAAEATIVDTPAKPESTCRIARGTATCSTGETVMATFSACEGLSSTGVWTGRTISTPKGDIVFSLGTAQLSPAAQQCGGTCAGCTVPTNCTAWAQGTLQDRVPFLGGPAAPYSDISGWMTVQKQVNTVFNGSSIMGETCSKLTVSGSSGAYLSSSITIGPTTAGAGTNALCCT